MPPVISTSGGAHGARSPATTPVCEIVFELLLATRRHDRSTCTDAAAPAPRCLSASRPAASPQSPRAIEQPPEVHVHHHWHGVNAEDAEIIRRQQDQ
jgi:hypothetical protein